MFPNPPPGLDQFSCPKGAQRVEYLKLILRELRSRKTELRSSFRAGGTVFPVGKAGGRQRAVWDGSRITLSAAKPPVPPHLASPSALQNVEVPRGGVLRMWKRDGKCLFDQLKLPSDLTPFMGRPPFLAKELCEATATSLETLREFWTSSQILTADSVVYPVGLVWAMGFGWSSWVSQCTMLDTCYKSGLDENMILADDLPVPHRASPVYCVATDDIVYLSSGPKPVGRRAARRLDSQFRRRGILKNADKDVDGDISGTMIGIDLVDGKHFAANSDKLAALIRGGLVFFMQGVGSPLQMAAFLGRVQWFNLLCRPTFAALDKVYEFARRADSDMVVPFGDDVLGEIAMSLILSLFLGH